MQWVHFVPDYDKWLDSIYITSLGARRTTPR